MQHIYKKISFLFLLACVILTPFAFVSADHTNTHTIEQLQQQITTLLAHITALQEQLNREPVSSPVVPPASNLCPRFTYNFYLGMDDAETGGQVTELQKILGADSEIYPEALITGYYGPLTEQAVRRYQKKHSIVSSGSPDTTGYGVVGPATRAKMRGLCGTPTPLPIPVSSMRPPIISGVSGPQSLDINQQGTWVVKAYDKNGGNLSYWVTWGDEMPPFGTGGANGMPGYAQGQQTSTFTHSYAQAGIYRITFYVTSENTIRCITTPCPTNVETAQTSLTVNVGGEVTNPTLQVLSPNGGEIFYMGDDNVIRWSGGDSLMDIYLEDASTGRTVGCIYSKKFDLGTQKALYWDGSSVSSDCQFSGGTDTKVVAGSNYKIRIVDADGPSDVSDAPFSVVVSSPTTSSSIQVLSPKQGDQWVVGKTYRISWLPFSPTADTFVYLSGGGNTEGYSKYIGGPSIGTNYYFDYTVTNSDLPARSGSSWKVAVCDGKMQSGGNSCGWSEEVFVASSPSTSPSIQVLSPNGGEVWQVGTDTQNKTSQKILWNLSGFTPNARLYLYFLEQDSYGNWTQANKLTNGIGSFLPSTSNEFTVYPDLVHMGNKKIRISNNPNEINMLCMDFTIAPNPNTNCPISPEKQYVHDDSDAPFRIVSATTAQPSITVLSPNGGETLQKGQTYQVRWNASPSIPKVTIALQNQNPGAIPSAFFNVVDVPNTGSYNWTVNTYSDGQASIITGSYKIRIVEVTGLNVAYDDSDAPFTISALPNPQLSFTGTQNYTGSDGNPYVKYNLSVTNWSSYSDSMFTSASNLPPCGLNANSSRTWINIYNATNNAYVYGFCALGSARDLTTIWFGILQGSNPPQSVYITINDRQTGVVYRSNAVVTLLPDLTVSDIYNDGGKLSIKVQNIGVADAPIDTGHLYIWIDDQLKWTYSVSTWSTKDYRLAGGVTIVQPQILSGSHNIKATIDPNGVISESNENNNMLEKTVTF
ncbi:MAG: hypothetical protein A3J55_00690 [Candidatus Ryanbacteria bacterium RIFCSPHIGHO2_02_FULL_45_17b]|uniref:PKD domain-containing protein n=1 Tax=Candidatus Ryanbacteria bacterium RIFCSPHIGHO2_01_FULL_45_22 TaxID=1802114 RepID=A0A1G2G0R6_9BACT|nr:MAG: hypothetical protein A2719_03155 [Candidatus Ryanbacteria bacterium RIFCSPHIGHO2_01_FULL_45_22]OGZ47060.1 MAG: hypothetical protein A3J55_00690 [Candidatus Ryanbacteria bacterium RIFCSPHIGHO2_02_FULL_45_17b]